MQRLFRGLTFSTYQVRTSGEDCWVLVAAFKAIQPPGILMKAIDLFSGPGGMTLGFKKAGIIPIACVEKRRDAVETYSGHTPDAEHFFEDIRKLNFEKFHREVDLVYGGPPCQPFSTGGLRKAQNDHRNMVPEFLRVLDEVKPYAFVMENVPGLVTKSRIHYLSWILNELKKRQYRTSWKVLMAADYGVPQKRRRLFVVGALDFEFWFPKTTHGVDRDKQHVPTNSVISKEHAIGEPPNCPVKFAKFPDPRRSPYAGHVYNGGGRPVDLNAPCHTILASAGGYKTHWIDTLDIAPSYTKHLLEGGEPWEGEVPGARRMTVEESALVQTFPENFQFSGTNSSRYTQVGDAVPPLLAEKIAVALLAQINGDKYSSKDFEPAPSSQLMFDMPNAQ